ncbi:MAG: ThiF family adenylyltransferase [Promethearchaeota archaeon]
MSKEPGPEDDDEFNAAKDESDVPENSDGDNDKGITGKVISADDIDTCKVQTEEEIDFQRQREELTWSAALKYAKEYVEDEDEDISSQEKELYARQALLRGWDQKVLKKTNVLIAGMNKLGRELAKDLALIGVGTITIVDSKVIKAGEKPQFLIPTLEHDRLAVEVIKDSLLEFNPFMKVNFESQEVEQLEISFFNDKDIIVGCMNEFKERSYLHQLCKKLEKPYLEGNCLGMEGFVQAWIPGDPDDDDGTYFSPVYCDTLPPDLGEDNQAAASIIAGILGQEIIKAAFKIQNKDIGDIQVPRYIKYDGTIGIFDPSPEIKDVLLIKDKKYALNKDVLKKTTVFIAGVGALGCEIAKDLSLAGIGKLILVDLDTIETSNLSRQLLFRLEDIGKPKAEVAAKRVKDLNPELETEFYFTKIQELPLDLYEKCDVIIAALDNVQARFDLNVISRRVKRPMIEGGTVGFEGHVQVIVPEGAKFLNETACYRCVVPIPPPDNKLIAACTPKGIPQTREHCVLRAEWIFRKKMEREPDLDNKQDRILLTGAANKELEMLRERIPDKNHGPPFVLQDMENILKNKIPAIQTVSSVIASIESMEALKMAIIQNSVEKPKDINIMDPTYLNYNGIWGIIDHLPVLKREDCPVCGTQKGIEYLQIPITADSVLADVFLSMKQIGIDINEKKCMITDPNTKKMLYHPSIPSMSDLNRRFLDVGIKAGNEILLTPYGVKTEDGSEPLKYQVTLISVS